MILCVCVLSVCVCVLSMSAYVLLICRFCVWFDCAFVDVAMCVSVLLFALPMLCACLIACAMLFDLCVCFLC